MAPIRTTLARSVSKLLGVSKNTDLSLRGNVQTSRVPPPPPFSATGGSKISSGVYTYHVWTTDTPSPTLNFDVTSGERDIDIMLVAGGGGGGANNSGGGGAGGMVYGEGFLTAGPSWSSIPVSIGSGGSGGPSSPEGPGSLGGDTTFGSSPNPYYLIAKAGGASGQWTLGNTGAPGSGAGGSGAGGPGNPTGSPSDYPLASPTT